MPVTKKKKKKKKKKEKKKEENKRRNRPQMPVAKKERPNHKCWWQTKNGCPNQASKQLTPNERKTKPQKLVANEKELP